MYGSFLSHNFVAEIISQKKMDEIKNKMDEMLYRAHRCIYFYEKTIEQCDTWLSAEEGYKNMERSIREREKTRKKGKGKGIKNWELGIKKIFINV